MKIEDLKKPFDPRLISWRVGATTQDKDKGIALAYLDARDVMERLDEVCGVNGWQNRYPYKGCCEISIWDGAEWVSKSNGAGETQVEADKGQYSDAFKRAAVLWGIGRYLYDVKNTWVKLKPQGRSQVIDNPNDSQLRIALENAAKGIRGFDEPEPNPYAPKPVKQPKSTPVNERELGYIIGAITSAIDMDALNDAKRNAKSAWSRLDKVQRDSVTDAVEETSKELDG